MPNTYYIPRSAFEKVRRSAVAADIHEVCFLFLGRGSRIKKVVQVPNRAEDTVLHHVFGTRDFDRVSVRPSLKDLCFLGFLHNHIIIAAAPSPGDIRGYPIGTLMFIYSDCHDQLRAFRLCGGRAKYKEKSVVIV